MELENKCNNFHIYRLGGSENSQQSIKIGSTNDKIQQGVLNSIHEKKTNLLPLYHLLLMNFWLLTKNSKS